MYLQITTKCNMKCAHCCYSCTMRGKHANLTTIRQAINFASNYSQIISIGGGEPTLHPDFFEILKLCLKTFDYVWMATNGSQTQIMYRLAAIIDGNDIDYAEYDCDCSEEDIENDECYCFEHADYIYQEDKLSVALSLDCFHDPINDKISELWKKRSNMYNRSNFEIRDVTMSNSGIIAQGRAKKTGSGWNEEDCVCADLLIKTNGDIKLCGCEKSPIIGNVFSGIDDDMFNNIVNDDDFMETNCYKSLPKYKLKNLKPKRR